VTTKESFLESFEGLSFPKMAKEKLKQKTLDMFIKRTPRPQLEKPSVQETPSSAVKPEIPNTISIESVIEKSDFMASASKENIVNSAKRPPNQDQDSLNSTRPFLFN
jgi:hypothetical protein